MWGFMSCLVGLYIFLLMSVWRWRWSLSLVYTLRTIFLDEDPTYWVRDQDCCDWFHDEHLCRWFREEELLSPVSLRGWSLPLFPRWVWGQLSRVECFAVSVWVREREKKNHSFQTTFIRFRQQEKQETIHMLCFVLINNLISVWVRMFVFPVSAVVQLSRVECLSSLSQSDRVQLSRVECLTSLLSLTQVSFHV